MDSQPGCGITEGDTPPGWCRVAAYARLRGCGQLTSARWGPRLDGAPRAAALPLAGFSFKYVARTGDALVRVLAVLGVVLLLVPTALAVLVAIFASSRESYVYWLLDGLKGLLQVVVAPLPLHDEMKDETPGDYSRRPLLLAERRRSAIATAGDLAVQGERVDAGDGGPVDEGAEAGDVAGGGPQPE